MSTPVPDPTLLTTEALHREISALHELIDEKIDAARALSDARLEFLKESAKQQNDANQLAISKSEAATAETLKALKASVTAITDAFYSRINDLKDQLNRIENRKLGATEERSEQRQSLTFVQGTLAAAGGVVAVVLGFFALHTRTVDPPSTVTNQTVITQTVMQTVTTKGP